MASSNILRLPARRIPSFTKGALVQSRSIRYQAFDAAFDPDELQEAREWHKSFDAGRLPRGQTTFARPAVPEGSMSTRIRASKYYTSRSDSLSFQAQTHRHRDANTDENLEKLVEEVQRIYRESVPGETTPGKRKKHEEVARSFDRARLREKKQHSSKKQSRRAVE
ncbi:conserved hypothetical protein [Verticillium alfalfae VaMs.102]|uniref:Peptidyl-tRNA hydrolase domain-containing protein n=1 Tax=Verticillium alfalfae (strain VaMs.102 / ATCC MYA-4576 / FGSC 10136) TaxID=526221 RepID=C9SGD7_VERA1|nr:conserved hypothetical protein [Verticillium alfalfae VaMs.102]EEY17477.1 conserved hypothetical protein [Verticillium alfalfae VaMs.102]